MSTTTIFNGNSRYSTDFQSIIDRTVAIASLPLSQLNTDKTALSGEAAALQSLDTKFQGLQTALSALDSAMGSGSIEATLSSNPAVTTSVSSGALEGTYTIEVLDQGAYTTSLTSDAGPRPVAYPASQSLSKLASPSFTLTVDGQEFTLSPATNTLQGLADAINAETSANLAASVVNAGTASAPDYRLSLESNVSGDIAVQLNDGSMDLLTEQTRGDAGGGVTTALSSVPGPNIVTNPDAQSLSNQTSPAFRITVGSNTFSLSPAGNTLTALADAINANSLIGARATVVNVGSNSAPDYRLSLKASKLDDQAVTLTDGVIELQAEQVRGSLASYKVNGSSKIAESDSRSVEISPGLTVNLTGVSPDGEPTSITLTRQSSAVSSALASLVNAYNAAVDEVDLHHGTSGGALSGQSVVLNLTRVLQSITSYAAPSAGVNSLPSLGISLDQTGHMAFDEISFLAASFGDPNGVTHFLGTTSSDGFLYAAAQALNGVEDLTTGSLKQAIEANTNQAKTLDDQIADKQSYIDNMRADLEQRMAAADALVASMEQQYNYISQMLDAMYSSNTSN